MTRPAASDFDRLRRRTPPEPSDGHRLRPRRGMPQDGQGRRALFSVDEPGEPAFGSVLIDCSSCHEVSVLAMRRALRLALPSLYLPFLRGRYPALLHCPACGHWAWTRVRVRL